MSARGCGSGNGGRWSSEAVDFIWQLAQPKPGKSHPSLLTKQHGVGTPMDKDVEHGVRCVVSGGPSLVESSQLVAGCPTDGDTSSWSEVLTHDPR